MARYRREYRNGNSSPASESTKWAGHAVFTSGITVGISYLALWIANIPLFSDAGISNAIGVLITISVANTLLIAILTRWKKRIFGRYRGEKEGKYFQKVASTVHGNRLKILGIFIVLTLVGSYVYFSTPTNMDLFSLVPPSSGIQAIEVVNSSFHGDFFDRGYIILEFQQPLVVNGTYNITEMNQISSLENRLMNNTGITQVYGPTFPYGSQVSPDLAGVNATYRSTYMKQMDTFIGNNTHYAVVDFQLGSVAWSSQSTKNVKNLDSIITSTSDGNYKFYVGGLTEGLNNAYSFTSNSFAKLVPILSIAIFLVLFIQLGSVFTPIRLIFMVLASVIISLSIAYAFLFYLLHLSILIFLPMFTVITLLAVGLDYDIFMITRVREEVMKGNDDAVGIAKSITENGGVIVTLGSLLFATFGALVFSQLAIIQEIGAGLALGVLIDTFVSWPFFVPAVMLLLKRLNWWPSKFSKKGSGNSGS
jgi:RND superfamily putative drug exporter